MCVALQLFFLTQWSLLIHVAQCTGHARSGFWLQPASQAFETPPRQDRKLPKRTGSGFRSHPGGILKTQGSGGKIQSARPNRKGSPCGTAALPPPPTYFIIYILGGGVRGTAPPRTPRARCVFSSARLLKRLDAYLNTDSWPAVTSSAPCSGRLLSLATCAVEDRGGFRSHPPRPDPGFLTANAANTKCAQVAVWRRGAAGKTARELFFPPRFRCRRENVFESPFTVSETSLARETPRGFEAGGFCMKQTYFTTELHPLLSGTQPQPLRTPPPARRWAENSP